MTDAERAAAIRANVLELEEHTRQLMKKGFRVVLNHSRLYEQLNPYGSNIMKVIIDKTTCQKVEL